MPRAHPSGTNQEPVTHSPSAFPGPLPRRRHCRVQRVSVTVRTVAPSSFGCEVWKVGHPGHFHQTSSGKLVAVALSPSWGSVLPGWSVSPPGPLTLTVGSPLLSRGRCCP